jgi:hypothetical protein
VDALGWTRGVDHVQPGFAYPLKTAQAVQSVAQLPEDLWQPGEVLHIERQGNLPEE